MKRAFPALAVAVSAAVLAITIPASAQDVSFLQEQQAGEVAIVRLAGTRVFNKASEVIGTIGDVVVGPDGQAKAVVINVGGFLGVGSKHVAVPYNALRIGPVLEGGRVLLVDVTKEQLQAAPEYKATDPSRTDRAKKKAADWLKIAKDKAAELGKQAQEAVESVRQQMSTPVPGGGTAPAPAPKQ